MRWCFSERKEKIMRKNKNLLLLRCVHFLLHRNLSIEFRTLHGPKPTSLNEKLFFFNLVGNAHFVCPLPISGFAETSQWRSEWNLHIFIARKKISSSWWRWSSWAGSDFSIWLPCDVKSMVIQGEYKYCIDGYFFLIFRSIKSRLWNASRVDTGTKKRKKARTLWNGRKDFCKYWNRKWQSTKIKSSNMKLKDREKESKYSLFPISALRTFARNA